MSLLSPSRCVLLLSDEGVGIYDVTSSRTQLLESVPWNTQDFEDAVAEIVRKKCRGKPILLFNDMVEQHYRKERVPRVSPFDKANVLKRRLSAAFPSYPIRASIKLKEKAPARDGQAGNGDIYLMAAVPLSESVRKTLGAVQKTYSSVSGFCLLPVESASMIHMLSKKLAKVSERAPTWTVFVGQHQSGGLRQIVTKNGELALTRMTPIVDTDIDNDLWANEVAGEIRGTMGYLSRFGFDANDGLDVIVIANNSVADKVASRIDFDCNLSVLTSQEAANLLGLKLGRQDDQRYADPLHIAWAGRKSSFALPLQSTQLEKISSPSKYATAASLILLAACGYFGYEAFTKASEWAKNNADLTRAQDALAVVKAEHADEIAKKSAAGVDFLLIENSTKVYTRLEKQSMKPLPVFDLIGRSLGPDIHIQSLEVRPVVEDSILTPAPDVPVDPNAELPQKQYDVVIKIVFPAELAPEVGVQKIGELERRLKQNLPRHQVSIIKQVADLSYTGNFVGEATSQQNASSQEKEDYEAQILIKGVLI